MSQPDCISVDQIWDKRCRFLAGQPVASDDVTPPLALAFALAEQTDFASRWRAYADALSAAGAQAVVAAVPFTAPDSVADALACLSADGIVDLPRPEPDHIALRADGSCRYCRISYPVGGDRRLVCSFLLQADTALGGNLRLALLTGDGGAHAIVSFYDPETGHSVHGAAVAMPPGRLRLATIAIDGDRLYTYIDGLLVTARTIDGAAVAALALDLYGRYCVVDSVKVKGTDVTTFTMPWVGLNQDDEAIVARMAEHFAAAGDIDTLRRLSAAIDGFGPEVDRAEAAAISAAQAADHAAGAGLPAMVVDAGPVPADNEPGLAFFVAARTVLTAQWSEADVVAVQAFTEALLTVGRAAALTLPAHFGTELARHWIGRIDSALTGDTGRWEVERQWLLGLHNLSHVAGRMVMRSSAESLELARDFILESNVEPPEHTDGGLRLKANGHMRFNRIGFVDLPLGETALVDLMLTADTAVNGNLALHLGYDDGHVLPAIIFEADHAICFERAEVPARIQGVTRLFTVISSGRHVRVYIDGMLAAEERLTRPRRLSSVDVTLMGQDCKLDMVTVRGLDIWSGPMPVSQFFPGENDTIDQCGRYCIETRNYDRLMRHTHAFPHRRLLGDDRVKLDCLKRLTESTPFYQDYLAEPLAASLASRDAWEEYRQSHVPPAVIETRDLTIRFNKNALGHRNMLSLRSWRQQKDNTFLALDGVSLDIRQGDVVGIIGSNGSGKSTLLKAITGAIPIERGYILVRDRPLLMRYGQGMRDELTGRENIIHAAIFLGLTYAETTRRIDGIIEFAELEDAIDRPYKYYSDGMKARLVFSLATSISPNILMLDELLSAGDVSFREKAAKRLEEFLGNSRVVVAVTHDLSFVLRKCNKAIVMSHGRVLYAGNPQIACGYYTRHLEMHRLRSHHGQCACDRRVEMIESAE